LVKGQTFLLKAIALVVRESRNVIFLIAGRGEEEVRLRKEAAELGISEYVLFLGYRSDVPELLDIMDVFVLPSLSECLPLCLLEAMAAGVPIISSDVGGIPEIIVDGENGYLVKPGQPSLIAEKILLLLESEEKRRRIGRLGLEVVRKRFSMGKMIRRYEELYLEAMSSW
jgi:glycosyltransferase involved in cell wall biosynthesis